MTQSHAKSLRLRKPTRRKTLNQSANSREWWRPGKSPQSRKLLAEYRYFNRIRKRLWSNPEYREKYVMMRNKQIIAVGTNQFDLARSAIKQFPGEAVLITKVELEPRVIQLPDMRFR